MMFQYTINGFLIEVSKVTSFLHYNHQVSFYSACTNPSTLNPIGIIPHNTTLMCGFVYIPSFESSLSSDCVLHVGNTDTFCEDKVCTTLKLYAKVYICTYACGWVLCFMVIFYSLRKLFVVFSINV